MFTRRCLPAGGPQSAADMQFLSGYRKSSSWSWAHTMLWPHHRHVLLLKTPFTLSINLQIEEEPAVLAKGSRQTSPPCSTISNFKLSVQKNSWTSTPHPALPACSRTRTRTRICQPSSPSWWRRWTGSSTGAHNVGGIKNNESVMFWWICGTIRKNTRLLSEQKAS